MGQLICFISIFMISNIIVASLLISSCSAVPRSRIKDNTFAVVIESVQIYLGVCLHSSGNYTQRSEYESNLWTVLSNMTSAAAASQIEANVTVGSGRDRVHGWFFCGNDNVSVCKQCVHNATLALQTKCRTRTAIVYTNNNDCQVSYSELATFPEIDEATSITDCSDWMPSMPDLAAFNRSFVASMESLIDKVVTKYPYFAVGEITDLYVGQNVSTVVTCSYGVSKSQCKECLRKALNETVVYCLAAERTSSALDLRPSCKMGYDMWLKFNSNEPAAFSPASSPSQPPPSLALAPTSSSVAKSGTPGWLLFPLWIIWYIHCRSLSRQLF